MVAVAPEGLCFASVQSAETEAILLCILMNPQDQANNPYNYQQWGMSGAAMQNMQNMQEAMPGQGMGYGGMCLAVPLPSLTHASIKQQGSACSASLCRRHFPSAPDFFGLALGLRRGSFNP